MMMCVLMWAVCSSAVAQKNRITEFSLESLPTQMLEYLNQATSDKDKQKANGQLINKFAATYESLSSDAKARVVSISNGALKLHVKPLPDVYNYLQTLLDYQNDASGRTNFDGWLSCLELIESRNKKMKDFTDFVEFSDALLKERTLGKSRSATWQAQASTPFQLEVEGNQIVVAMGRPFELYYSSDKDNGTIYGTTGRYYYFDGKWIGQGGRINWDRTGIPTTACWAELSRYEAQTKFAKFVADSVRFTNTNYFTTPILGRVEEALSSAMPPEKYTYPKFRSYQKDFQLKDILPGVDYSGSFMMNGSKFITSDTKHPATLIFYRNEARFLTVMSTHFTITHDRIVSENATVRIFLDGDSIGNDGITVRYIVPNKQVVLINDSKRNYYSPYSDTYHKLDMYCESIIWKMKEDQLDFSMLGQTGTQNSTFESDSYYSERKFRELQGIDEVNPVVRVYRYMKSHGMTYEFFIDEFAAYIHMDIIQAKSMIHTLAHSGLVTYNESENRVYVKDKLVDYHMAYTKTVTNDYDALVLESSSNKSNATLELSSNDLRMQGVRQFVLSDSQQVVIYPQNGNIVVKRNRDIDFSGRVDAGRFILFVSNASFLYDEFRLDLPTVDSLKFFVTMFNNPQKDHIVLTPLYSLTGNLFIDAPNNHSGLKKTKGFPTFESLKNSYVYYDRNDIHHGAYKRDIFYFTLRPFVIKDMVDFVTDSLRFGGVLTSANIFPDIDEELKVQRDYSLGFTTKTKAGGYPCYGGKGTYTNVIDLSNKGLRGAGKLDYLSATLASREFYFMPDSSVGVTDTFVVRPEGGFPDIHVSKAQERWFPKADSMRVQQIKGGPQFAMYRDEAHLAGNVILRPQGALAEGAITIGEGTIESDRFVLQTRIMDAQVSNFTLRSEVYNNIAFVARNMKCHTDFDARRVDFTSNTPMGRTELPLLSYAAYVDKFSWQIDKKELDLLNSKSESTGGLEGLTLRERLAHPDQPGARFVSTDPKRDSLSFNSCRGSYLYNAGQLSCRQVFLIKTADAVVAPAADTVHIQAGGVMDLLRHSQLLASRENKYHLVYDADIMVHGAKSYDAKGYIDYIDEHDGKQPIYLDKIAPNPQGVTIGTGFVPDSVGFKLNDAFGFAGKVRMEADKPFFFFEGGVRLLHHCAPNEKVGLLAYSAYLDPKQIRVQVPEIPTDWHGNPITASVLFSKTGNMEPFNAFLTNDRPVDNQLLSAAGFLSYDSKNGRYIIADERKLSDPDNVVDRYLSLNTKSCLVEGEGPVNFGVKQNHVRIFSYGTVELPQNNTDGFELNTTFGFSFPIEEKVQEAMTQFLTEDLRLAPSSPDNDVLRRTMMYHLGAEEGAEAYTTYVSTGFYEKIPKAFESTLLFEGINWKYNPALGYYYNGVAGLAAIGKKQVHLNVRVKAQIYHRGNATYLILYVQAAADHWYYFNYEFNSQLMTVQSSNGEWLDMIRAIPADQRQTKGKDGVGDYRYRVGTSRTEVPNFTLRIDNLKIDPNEQSDNEDEEEEE